MAKLVNLPNGQQASFPDDMPNEQIQSVIQQHLSASQTTQQAQPQQSGSWTDIGGMTRAAAKGLYHGFDSFATTLDKGIAKLTGNKEMQEGLQATYDANTSAYNQDKDTNAHPLAAGIGNITPSVIFSTPAPMVSGLLKGAAVGAGLGATMGGLSTQRGQDPNSVINGQGAAFGGLLGGLVGAGAGSLTSYMDKTSNIENAYNALSTTVNGMPVKYAGKLSDADLGQTNKMTDWVGRQVTDSFLGKVPFLVPSKVGSPTETAYGEAMTGYVTDYLNALAGNGGVARSYQSIQNSLNKTNQTLRQTVNDFAKQTLSTAEKEGKSFINFSPTDQVSLVNTINQFGDYLDKSTSNTISKMMANGGSDLDTLIGPKGILHDIYPADLLKKIKLGTATNEENQAAASLLSTYNNIKGNITNELSGTDAEQALHSFYQASQGMYGFRETPNLAKAVESIGNTKQGFNTFYKALLSGNKSPEWQRTALGAIGTEGQDAASAQSIMNMVKSSVNPETGSLDISKFIQQTQNQNVNKAMLNQPTLNALQGMLTYINNNQQSSQVPMTILGQIFRNSPVKNALISINNFIDKPEAVQYFSKKITNFLRNVTIDAGTQDTIKGPTDITGIRG